MVDPSDPMQGKTPPDSVSRGGVPIPQSYLDWKSKHDQFLKDNPPPSGVSVNVEHHGHKSKHGA